jgi:DNA-binding NtrC family response regulator
MEKRPVLLGISSAIQTVKAEIELAARSDAKVLITGESGVGKEVVARLIHEDSRRRANPLVTINCAGFPDSLLESELFGHVKGSFTDAHRDKKGWLEAAHGGTIFMDEVGEMSLRMQALLLRFLETGEIQRVGSDRALPPLNVRVIAATHRPLLEHVQQKTFRDDLFYRLNVIHIEVPPLRNRTEDIPVLLRHFLAGFAATHGTPAPEVTTAALQRMLEYSWPGNVRELRNVAERLVLRATNGRIDVDMLPAEVLNGGGGTAAAKPSASVPASASPVNHLFDRLMRNRASFWSEVYEPFMARDLTREDLRALVRLGLEQTRGNYKMLVRAFNMPAEDYKRFLMVLRRHECHVSFQSFRVMRPETYEAVGLTAQCA